MNFDLGGRTLAYDESGDPGAPPVVLMHGLSGARTSWFEVAPRLAETDHVFAYDHRGHGDSTPTPDAYRVDDYTDDAAAFIEQVVGGEAVVVGHSLGGLTAADLTATRPELVTCAFLEDPPLYMGDPEVFKTTIFGVMFPLAQQLLRDMRDRNADVDEFVTVIGGLPAIRGGGTMGEFLGEEGTRRQAETWRAFDPEAFTAAIDGSLFAGYDTERKIERPVRVLRAEPTLGAAFFAEHTEPFIGAHQDAEVELVVDASHSIHDEQLDLFVDDLTAFLRRHVSE